MGERKDLIRLCAKKTL